MSQRISFALLCIVVVFWLRGCTSGSIYSTASFATLHRYTGVVLSMSGHNSLNSFKVTGFTERWGFYHITGFEAGHAVNVLVAPHWLFLLLIAPPALWFTLATMKQSQRRARAAGGLCVSCGYSLAGNTTGVCPECGAKLKSLPFHFHAPGLEVSEGTIDVDDQERFSLTVSTAVTDANPLEKQIKYVNEAMLRWLRSRGEACGRLVISVAADPSERQPILSWALRLVNQNIPESGLLKKLQVELLLRDSSGKPFDQMILGSDA